MSGLKKAIVAGLTMTSSLISADLRLINQEEI